VINFTSLALTLMLTPTPMMLARICNPSAWKCYTRITTEVRRTSSAKLNPSERGYVKKSEQAGLYS